MSTPTIGGGERAAILFASSLLFGLALTSCSEDSFFGSPGPAPLTEVCGDQVDNDGDGLLDCADPDCELLPACSTQLSTTIKPGFPTCASVTGDRSATPVDIIWTVDSSPSMVDEMSWIQENLNDFVAYLAGTTLDVRVVLLGGEKICVPEPLAAPNCADGARLRHLRQYVGSHDSLRKIISLYPEYQAFLRDGRKALVMTTDDNSQMSAEWFAEQAAALVAPGFGNNYVVHSIVAWGTHPKGCLTGAAAGRVYVALSEQTHGIKYPICETDWTKIFYELGNGIVGMVEVPCAYVAPSVPVGQALNPEQIHVLITEGNQQRTLGKVQGAGECAQKAGWFYEPSASTVRLCPDVCKSLHVSRVRVSFGCQAIVK